jgi:CBS domain containing-hemolysin-like protein
VVGPREFRIASNLVKLPNIRVGDVLTPRTVVFSLPAHLTVREVLAEHYPLRFARIPVYEGEPDHIVGYVPRYQIHRADADGQHDRTLEQLANTVPVLPELATVGKAMETMLGERQQIAIVVDEYGSMEGILTLEDLLETLLGEEIVDETDTVEDMQAHARSRIRFRG